MAMTEQGAVHGRYFAGEEHFKVAAGGGREIGVE